MLQSEISRKSVNSTKCSDLSVNSKDFIKLWVSFSHEREDFPVEENFLQISHIEMNKTFHRFPLYRKTFLQIFHAGNFSVQEKSFPRIFPYRFPFLVVSHFSRAKYSQNSHISFPWQRNYVGFFFLILIFIHCFLFLSHNCCLFYLMFFLLKFALLVIRDCRSLILNFRLID